MRIGTLLAFVLLGACAQAPTAPRVEAPAQGRASARELTPLEHLARGKERLRASEYADARADFEVAQSASAEADLGLAEVALLTGRHAQAVKLARSAGQRDAALAPRAATLAARALGRSGLLGEAEAELRPFAAAESGREARLALAEVLLETGRRKEAEPLLMTLVEDYNSDRIRDDDGPGLGLAARAAWLLRSPRDANTLFNLAEQAHAGTAQLLLWRARFHLDKYDPGRAEQVLLEVLERAPHHPEALTLLAHVRLDQALDFDEAERLAREALEQNPKLAGAYFVLAGIALRDMELEHADRLIGQGLAENPRDLPLLSLRATVRFLADDDAGLERAKRDVLSLNREYSELFAILGEYADWEHRYDEIVQLMREALAIDAEDSTAYAQLGFNLIRAGTEQEGVSALSRAFSLDPYNVRVYNTLNLFDTVIPKAYVTVEHPRFRIRYHKQDRDVLERYVPKLLDRAFDTMAEGYGFTPQTPIGIEIYAERESFAVRTSGLPRTAIQGVCFGKTLASMSPQNESFNLGMTLWHELSHVFHIQLSRSRVPRWFTEGLAEYETLVTRPEWSREHDAELFEMLKAGKLPVLAQMSRAFTRAEELSDVATAYYASSRIVTMLANQHGRKKMGALLALWGKGRRTEAVFEEGLGEKLVDIDRRFRASLEAGLGRYRQQFVPLSRIRARRALEEEVRTRPRDAAVKVELALSLARSGERDPATRLVEEALKLDPKHAQARFLRARLAVEGGKKKQAEELLRAMVKDGQDGYAVDMQLAALAQARGDSASARAALELAHRKDPTQSEPLEALAELAQAENVPAEELVNLEKLSRLSEHDAVVHQRLLERLLSAKRPADAVKAGEAAIWADLNGFKTHRLFAEALAQTGDVDRARFELETALLCPAEASEQAEARARLSELAKQPQRSRPN